MKRQLRSNHEIPPTPSTDQVRSALEEKALTALRRCGLLPSGPGGRPAAAQSPQPHAEAPRTTLGDPQARNKHPAEGGRMSGDQHSGIIPYFADWMKARMKSRPETVAAGELTWDAVVDEFGNDGCRTALHARADRPRAPAVHRRPA
jgi:hypothetical protein